MGVATAVAIGVTAVGGYLASQQAKEGAQAQADAAAAAADAFRNIPIPSVEDQKVILQNPQLAGKYTPQQLQAMQMMTSAMSNVSADQNAVQSQNSALNQLGEISKGGLTEADKGAARQIEQQVAGDAQARQKAILNQMASRGVLGSGMELAAQLQSAQQATQQQSNAADNLQGQAQARALQALSQQGALAGQARGQSFGEGQAKAQAQDAISQFNLQNAQNVANTNNSNANQAAMYNLQQQQAINNQAAANANQQEMYNKQLQQTHFANQMGQAQNMSNALQAQGNAQAAAANANAAGTAAIAGGIGSGLMGYAGMQNANSQNALNRQNAMDVASVNALKKPGAVGKLPASQYDPYNPGNA